MMHARGQVALLTKNNRSLSVYVYSGAKSAAGARAVDQAGGVPVSVKKRGDGRTRVHERCLFRDGYLSGDKNRKRTAP
jgi:rhodanese-related sulfurtransferase